MPNDLFGHCPVCPIPDAQFPMPNNLTLPESRAMAPARCIQRARFSAIACRTIYSEA
ncbi:MAG: hypothetical protein JGK10_02800 [Microcoleus sp. PH2017_13_LAR_U_A]|uniref:hypothetical protein n=1 Tax=unclassified Microcoleus TaxID=2642155 RepID=UPI001D7F3F4C|nr:MULTISPECIES: hypothetical protein [unclassified Microcoleus]MCC3511190.1 hypothetical protein [Microcoleus sp. PH2017_17_BER_D_A]MCC3564374.1 hypothetical protein [Microcoleus sp. PH2017_31_RDM_U_A]MCC3446697.1 hypothetical protein [Microcoleus sp. PH2017_09_SFU_O_A]MCC3470755.1 hypothetical protein [Microcoleus sp. PH2017_13_LAR_U_A]MCC3620857.1 hypothetical protein [Microcoleus sp. PH2017_36_ELK_O_B]